MKYNAVEAIQHRGETVTEGSSSNAYAIKISGVIYTHPINNYILNGITRIVIKKLPKTITSHLKKKRLL